MDYILEALKSFSGLEFSYLPETGEITIHKGDVSKEEILLKSEEIRIEEPMRQLRMKRTAILAESDWMANSDVTMSDAWRDYRQALRDLPANSPNVALDEQGNLINVTWPTKPE